MIRNTKIGRTQHGCDARECKLSPTARAIRLALVGSAALLAVTSGGVSYAGTCSSLALNTIDCTGAFSQTVPGTLFLPVADLTLILGGSAPASVTPSEGFMGVDASWTGNVGVISHANITTAGADGIHQYGSTSATLNNDGQVATDVTTAGVTAVDISSYGDVNVVNGGDILAYSDGVDDVTAVLAYSSHGNVVFNNLLDGTVTASAGGGNAIAVDLSAYLGSADVTNAGTVIATSLSGTAGGISAHTNNGQASISNNGNVVATSDEVVPYIYGVHVVSAVGLMAQGLGGAIIVNSGTISVASADGDIAIGALAISPGGDGSIANTDTGSITVSGNAHAYGAVAETVYNAGQINVSATRQYSYADGTLDGRGYAFGIVAKDVVNAGGIAVYASGIGKGIVGANVDNSGSISVMATKVADGIYASGAGTITNSGTINLTADPGRGGALGIFTRYAGLVDNSGTITTDGFNVAAIVSTADSAEYGASIIVENSGAITAHGVVEARGILADNSDFNLYDMATISINNAGSISATADRSSLGSNVSSFATGIDVFSSVGGQVDISNAGSIQTLADDISVGINVTAQGNVTVANSGTIAAAGFAKSEGLVVRSTQGTLKVDNAGEISVNADNTPGRVDPSTSGANVFGSTAYGMWLYNVYGDTYISNAGSVNAHADSVGYTSGATVGLVAQGKGDYIGVLNTGEITAYASTRSDVYGALADGVFLWDPAADSVIDLANSGAITAVAHSVYGSAGRQTQASGVILEAIYGAASFANGELGSITATATSDLYNSARATGVFAFTNDGVVDLVNAGAISADARSNASSYLGNVSKTRADGIQISGVLASTISVDNAETGSITAYAGADHYGSAGANGINLYTITSEVNVANAGTIIATAKSGATTSGVDSITTSNGILLVDRFGTSATVSNSSTGLIASTAFSNHFGAAIATGINVYSSYTLGMTNAGAVSAIAQAQGHSDAGDAASATGILISNLYGNARIVNSSTSSIAANASADLSATASGQAIFGSIVDMTSGGGIIAAAFADLTHGTALATGLLILGSDVGVSLDASSHIDTVATGYDGTAVGVLLSGNSVAFNNAGRIEAQFFGTNGNTYGAIIASEGDLLAINSGDIIATDATDHAIALDLNSATRITLINSGSITAASTSNGGVAVLAGDSMDTIQNSGTLNGALLTNGANDTLNNGLSGLWRAIGSSDFGSGDDTVTNAGTIVMTGSSIALGDSDTFANAFSNSGTIASFGDSTINMGAKNVNAFANTGIIDFRDGFADDTLTIDGDFAGSGQLGVDLSGLNGTGDVLYINGNVVNGSVTTVNATILDVPTTPTGSIGVVKVSGDSTAGNFVLGDVTFNPNQSFVVATAVGMSNSIDTSNASADVFSVDFTVTGLSDAGTLGASFAPGVQSLMNSQVGTWRQRMGVVDRSARGVSLWARSFTDSGTIDPGHVAKTFGQGGNFTFDQRNDGNEVGADFGITEQINLGLLAGHARATQRLNGTGIGSTKLDGHTSGAYATWFSPNGSYVDASYRHMTFDAMLHSAAGESRTRGNANAFNVEAGYAFELVDGYKLEPQLQYTNTQVGHANALGGALTGFTPDGGTSSRGRVGVSARKSFSTNGKTILTPYIAASAVHEFDGKNSYAINNTFFGTTSTKGTSTLVEGGLNIQVDKLAVFGGLNWQDGGTLKSFTGGQLGVRYSW